AREPGCGGRRPSRSGRIHPRNSCIPPAQPGRYVPEWSQGQELVQYLSQLEGHEYAVVDQDGRVTGVLYQSSVVTAITGK
ncbi:peptidase M50, partial [Arthrobacter sp. Hiyo6]